MRNSGGAFTEFRLDFYIVKKMLINYRVPINQENICTNTISQPPSFGIVGLLFFNVFLCFCYHFIYILH